MKTLSSNLTIIFICLATTVFSQYYSSDRNFYFPALAPGQSLTSTSFKDVNNSEILNSITPKMYLSPEYLSAKIDGNSELFKLKYNIFTDEMEFEKDGKVYTLEKEIGQKIYFKNSSNYFQVVNFNGKLQYFEVLDNRNVKLLVRKIVEFKKGKKQTSSYDKSIEPNFIRKSDKLYIKIDKEIFEVPSKNEDFFSFLQNKPSNIKDFMKRNKLNVNNRKDLLKIVNYLNSI
tara:strand:- start:125 stop:817 length:693 start_codon:yes stop_codon:yes gene_type:complete